jgi:dipeptidyl aminopeptidase/acylaminoacyl peptidase
VSTVTGHGPGGSPPVDIGDFATTLSAAWGCWAPTLTHDGRRIAFVSDRRGSPEVWIESVDGLDDPTVIAVSDDPVLSVHWSPDGQWLAIAVATGGGVRSEVWVARPDGSECRRVAGDPSHAAVGPWVRTGHRLVVTIRDPEAGQVNRCMLIDAVTGEEEVLTTGELVEVLDLSADGRFVLLRDGPRGAHICQLLDRDTGALLEVLPYPGTGSTELGLLRPPPSGESTTSVAYVVTDAGQPRRALVAVPFDAHGLRSGAGAVAVRQDAELEFADANDDGSQVLVAWNVDGRSELELLDTASGSRRPYPNLPGAVVGGGVVARDGHHAVLAVEGPTSPSRLWELELDTGRWRSLTQSTIDEELLVTPTFERFESHDGLGITGWLYRPEGAGTSSPAVVSLHGGPESQERPGFHPDHQLLASVGFVVFAPNIRGSSGFGRSFVHADDRYGRVDAIADVAAGANWLAARGLADPARIAVSGRSYGGYAVLMALTTFPEAFAAGVDICGMSDLVTFFRDTEPWIASAAVTKYGDPVHDADLLERISPLRHIDRVTAPLLVVHGALDSNVPLTEGLQVVAALRALGRPVEYLELEGEGHEYRTRASRRLLLTSLVEFLVGALGGNGDDHPGGRPTSP